MNTVNVNQLIGCNLSFRLSSRHAHVYTSLADVPGNIYRYNNITLGTCSEKSHKKVVYAIT